MSKTTILCIALAVLILTNFNAFRLMKSDKGRAKRGDRRIPEKTLFLATACFGGLGGVLGMQLLRHKTQHWYFEVFFPLMLAVQVALLIWGAGLLLR